MKVSVIIPHSAEYKPFYHDAVRSVRRQSYGADIINVEMDEHTGLTTAANIGAARAEGEYIMRLDCDDKLHPLAIFTMMTHLERNGHHAAVCSDYWEMDKDGNVGNVVKQPDPPHPACMMIRKSVFEKIGGFNEDLKRQEGTDFFYRLTKHHEVGYIDLPLWYYRRHDLQMSNAHNEVIKARHEVKENHNVQAEKILAIIPARGGSKGIPRKNLVELNGIPLVSHAVRMAKSSRHDIYVVVSTEDEEIFEVALKEGVEVWPRDEEMAGDEVDLITLAKHTMEEMEPEFKADIVITIQPTAPFTPVSALDNALDRMLDNKDLDAVVSMSEFQGKHPWRLYWKEAEHKFFPYHPTHAERCLQRQDRPEAYCFTGGFYVRRRHLLHNWNGKDFALGAWQGELVPPRCGIDIDTPFDLWMAQAMVSHEEEL